MSWGVKCVMAKAVRAPEQRETVMFVGSGGHGTARSAGSWSGRKQGVAPATYYCALGPFLRNGRDDLKRRRPCRLAFLLVAHFGDFHDSP